jgi:hypothetical protein
VGQHEELPSQGWQRLAACFWPQWRARLHGEKRTNQTHASTTDPDARLYRNGPGQPAKLAYLGHVLMENRHALVVDTRLTLATGTAEREAALEMVADPAIIGSRSVPTRPTTWPSLSPIYSSTM